LAKNAFSSFVKECLNILVNFCVEEIKNSVIADAKVIIEITAENHHLCLLTCLTDRKNDCQFAGFGSPTEIGKNGTCKLYAKSQKHLTIQRRGKDQTLFKLLTECPKENEKELSSLKVKGRSAYGSVANFGNRGHWGPWSTWSECVADCTGLWSKHKVCKRPINVFCLLSAVQTRVRTCGICGINYAIEVESQPCGTQLDPWDEWSQCSASCGSGLKRRSRICSNGQNSCIGSVEETATCMIRECAYWSEWGNWLECSATCGEGTQKKFRKCIGEDPDGTMCVGPSFVTQPCPNLPPCCTQWSSFGHCSATCGSGVQIRTRKCGTELLEEEKPCLLKKCPRWSNWGEWEACSVTCGRGRKTKLRTCIGGVPGEDCTGESLFTEECFQGPCPTWSDWQAWTPCSVPCGEGSRVRGRTCLHGNDCVGLSRQTKVCYQCPCPTWTQWNPWDDCEMVNGQFVQTRTRVRCISCGMTEYEIPGKDADTQICPESIEYAARKAVMGEWSEWSECDVSVNH
uniref:Hemicentin-1 n=1 Tax=Soboliphyme baturini TaxID=241478 RepID=A0A183J1E2_9BILA